MKGDWKKHPLAEYSLYKTNPGFMEWCLGGEEPDNYKEEIEIWNKLHGHRLMLSDDDHPIDNVGKMHKLYMTVEAE